MSVRRLPDYDLCVCVMIPMVGERLDGTDE